MARSFRPSAPFSVPMKILQPTTTSVYGVAKKTYTDPADSELFYGSFKTFGGTESTSDGVYTLIDTAVIDTWYRPDINAACRIYVCDTQQSYEIISDPEDVELRHQYLQFKVRKVGGKA